MDSSKWRPTKKLSILQTLKTHTKNEEAIEEIDDIIDKSKELQKEAESE